MASVYSAIQCSSEQIRTTCHHSHCKHPPCHLLLKPAVLTHCWQAQEDLEMSSPVAVLRQGLKNLENQHKGQKEKLLAQLKAGRSISEDDQDWLDGAVNLVDEAHIVDMLENVADYESGVRTLNTSNQIIFNKLLELGTSNHGGGLVLDAVRRGKSKNVSIL